MDLLIMLGIAILVFVSLILVAIGLFTASWQLLLLLLLGILVVSQWLLRQNQPLVSVQNVVHGMGATPSHPPETGGSIAPTESSHLSYRGVQYDNPGETATVISMEQARMERAGKYRGCVWRNGSQPIQKPPAPMGAMKYRGARIVPPGSDH